MAPTGFQSQTDTGPTRMPNPLSVPSGAHARVCTHARIPGGIAGGVERYRRFYRSGRCDLPGLDAAVAGPTRVDESPSPEGVVRKFTLAVDSAPGDERTLETESVIIPMIGRKGILSHTLCVSSQVGCAMGCVFCQTGQMGLIRQLSVAEIVRQWWVARHDLGCNTVRNVVFMGMGEPMDNLDAVIGAIAILTDHNGPALPMSKITVSTVGRLDGIALLADQVRKPGWHRLNLAISVNAPNDEVRSRIMPVNRAMPMGRLREALEIWPIYGAAKLCLEYVLIPGVNDREEHARELGDWVLGRDMYAGRPALPGLVNVIPYNPRDNSPWPAPEEARVNEFLAWLLETGVYAKRRRTKGRDTMAACGQLGNVGLKKQRSGVGVPSISVRS